MSTVPAQTPPATPDEESDERSRKTSRPFVLDGVAAGFLIAGVGIGSILAIVLLSAWSGYIGSVGGIAITVIGAIVGGALSLAGLEARRRTK